MSFLEKRPIKKIAVLVLMTGFLIWAYNPQILSADDSVTLLPSADGTDDSANWTNTVPTACNSTDCFVEVDESSGATCTNSDGDSSYIVSSTNGANQTFDIDESSIPNNAVITQITVVTCDKRGEGGAKMRTRICVDGTCTNSGTDIALDSSYLEHSQAHAVSITKTAGTDIEIGVSNTAAKSARVSKISAIITYDATAPAAVTNLAASNATGSSIDLSWTAPGDDGDTGTAATYDVRYSTSTITEGNWSSATQVSGEPVPSIAGSSESMTVSGLNSNTTYYFALKTSDEAPNVSGISNVPSLATLDITAPAAVSNLAATNATGSSIDLSWTAPGDDVNSGTASLYDVRYSTSNITGGNWSSATQATGEPTPSIAGSTESITVSGLNSETAYYFALKTSDEVPNVSGLSNVPSLATLDITAPVISNISSGTPGETSATITWDTNEAATSQVEYGPTTSYGSMTTLDADLVTAHSVAITGLTRDTDYHFRVKSKDASSIEAVSGDESFTTSVLPGPVISNISSSNIKQTEAAITWTTDTASTSQVLYGTTIGNYTESTVLDTDLVTSHSVSLTGLAAATVYYYVVQSVDAGSHASVSSEYFFTTLNSNAPPDTVPPEIYSITVSDITQTAATIAWTTDEAATSQVEYGLTADYGYSSALDSTIVTAHSISLAELEGGTLYHFRVKSKDNSDNEGVSADQNFTTESGEELPPEENDTTPPVISDLVANSITDSQATIIWVTDEAATSRVFYGTTSGGYSNITSEDATKVLSHSRVISGLSSSTSYYYIVKSKDASGNEASSGEKFFITAKPAPTAPGAPGTTKPKTSPGGTVTEKEILPTQGDTTPPVVTLEKITPNPTDNQKPTITGTATDQDGVIASLAISLNDGKTWHPVTTIEGLGADKAVFTYIPALLEDGDFSIKARARDNSGNEGFSETQALVIDLLPPIFGGKSILIGNQSASISYDGTVNSVVGLTQKIVISAKGGPTAMTVAAQSQNSKEPDQIFDLRYVESENLWAGDLVFASSGIYNLELTAKDGAGHITNQVLNAIIVQPAGEVLEAKTGRPVSEARVALYQRDSSTNQWILWPAEAFGQHNPQVTGENGEYQFFVQPGQYYLEVYKEDWQLTVSRIITLDMNGPISGDILLTKKPSLHLGIIDITLSPWSIFAKSVTVSPSTSTQESSSHLFDQVIGQPAPEFILADSNGGKNWLSDQRGKKVVISVWNTWDSKSQEQLAWLEQVAEKKGIYTTILPLVLQESPSKVQTYLKRGGYSIVSLVDTTGAFTTLFPVISVPQHFFIDRKGILRDIYVGFLDEDDLIQKVDAL
ncbi:MAG: fibronectin type III domain-containing protein [Patescibacteria group bacterium]|nr:fibronectin type III domain-containing protein [Patescibacteria group bacterium]